MLGVGGRCKFPTYNGPIMDKENPKAIRVNFDFGDNTLIGVSATEGGKKSPWYWTRETLTGEDAGKIDGDEINGNPLNFGKCKQMCNSESGCKSFLYYGAKETKNKYNSKTKTRDPVDVRDSQCIFYKNTCDDPDTKCIAYELSDSKGRYRTSVIDKDFTGVYDKVLE